MLVNSDPRQRIGDSSLNPYVIIYFAVDRHSGLTFTSTSRHCAAGNAEATCKKYDDEVPEFGLNNTLVTGEVCYCTGDLCNSAPAMVIGHLTASFIVVVVSVLALTTARLLGQ